VVGVVEKKNECAWLTRPRKTEYYSKCCVKDKSLIHVKQSQLVYGEFCVFVHFKKFRT